MDKKFIPLAIAVVVVALLAVAAGSYSAGKQSSRVKWGPGVPMPQSLRQGASQSPYGSPRSDWKTYQGPEYSFQYPSGFTAAAGDPVSVSGPRSGSFFALGIGALQDRGESTWESYLGINDPVFVNGLTTLSINGRKAYRWLQVLGSHAEQHTFILKDDQSGIDASYNASRSNYDNSTGKKIDPDGGAMLENPDAAAFEEVIRTISFH